MFYNFLWTDVYYVNEVKLDDVNQKRRRVALILRMVLIRETTLRRHHPYTSWFAKMSGQNSEIKEIFPEIFMFFVMDG